MWPNTCCLPPKFAQPFVLECSWENVVYPEAFENTSLCKIRDGGRKGGKQSVLREGGFRNSENARTIRIVRIHCQANGVYWLRFSDSLVHTLDNIEKRNTKGLSTYLPRPWLQGRASLFLLPHKHEPAGNKHRWIDKYKNRIKCY